MRVSLVKNKKIQNIILPNKVEGNYWITTIDSNGIKRNLISIEAFNNEWRVVSNKDIYYVVDEKKQSFLTLRDYCFYYLKNEIDNSNILLFCSPTEVKYDTYDITNNISTGITIGSSDNSTIFYKNIEPETATIKSENDKIYIYDNKSKYGIYVNNVRISKKQLKIGDIIFIIGLKIIFTFKVDNTGKKTLYLLVNNFNNRVKVNLPPSTLIKDEFQNYEEKEDDVEFPLYDENEYFHKMPRFASTITPLEINVDAPPAKQEDANNSALLTIGPMLTMSMTSMVTGYTAINNVTEGVSTWKRAIPSLVMTGAMFASIFIWPVISKSYQKKMKKKSERLRQQKYGDYIEEKRKLIIEAKKTQSIILNNNFPNIKICEEIILKKYTNLWQRRIEDEDFLLLNLGYGNIPMKININYPEEHFSMLEDNLKEMVATLGNEPKMLINVPIVFSLIENYVTGLIGEEQLIGEYTRRLLLQIMAFHSYEDLKIVVLTDDENEYQWKFLKDLPHCFTDDKSLRFFATNSDEYKEVCYYLDRIFKTRKEESNGNDPSVREFDKQYLIITDSFKKIRDFDITEEILENKSNYGFNLFILDKKITNLPDQCKSIIELNEDKGELHKNSNYNEAIKFDADIKSEIEYEECVKKLSNIPVNIDSDEEGQLPNKIGFLEMYDVGKIEQLNSLLRWQNSNPILNLQVPVGVGKNGERISIDLHEKYHGPHGLIAGMTGSGKSEFIITYILSMAINYHPYEVQFILIDYKGGGLAGAFENSMSGLKLPHLIGTITNLDANEIKRSLASIESELKRRQALFNKAREASGESTIDIYKYQKMYREKLIDEPVSHLFIICDEFAELKVQQPEFMDQLISTARIGRSLGVHLILATQKPSGVVDPQIWSNSRFRVCLRVQEKSDSNEVIKTPDAAFLKQTGRFFFQVGYNEVFVLGQAAWAGGKYFPEEKVKKTIDTSLKFIDNIGFAIKNVETRKKQENIKSNGEELINTVKYLSTIAKEQNISCRPLWLEKIPEFIKVEDLAAKYNYIKEKHTIDLIIGEYDIPNRQEQKLLTLPISKEGNVLVYGAAGSGKENFITTLLYSSMLFYTSEELNYYIIDFGTESLKMFKKCPLVGDVLSSYEDEKINNLYKMINSNIEQRKELFAEYNGDYSNYCKNSGKTVPYILIIINNFESYQEMYSKYDDILNMLSREGEKYGIYFILTLNTPNGLRFKLKQNFSLTYVLQQNNPDDYITILGNVNKTYPTKIFGRGIMKTDAVYEFQTALVTEKDNITKYIKEKCDELSIKSTLRAKNVPVLPSIVTYQDISSEFGKSNELIIGINKDELEIVKFNFEKNYSSIITSIDIDSTVNFINPLINQIIATNKSKLFVINAEEILIDQKYTKFYQYYENKFDEVFSQLLKYVNEKNQIYKENNYNKEIFKNEKSIECIIIGLDSFKNKLNDENRLKFEDIFNNAKDLGVINYILVDSINKIKKNELEIWYKNSVNTSEGIWVGNGINDQFSIKLNQRIEAMKENVPNNFCFVIKKGKPIYVKYLEKLELNIKQ